MSSWVVSVMALLAPWQAAAAPPVVLDVPRVLAAALLETAIVCRDAHGGWHGLDVWRPIETPEPVVHIQRGCRVLLRRAGTVTYLASEVATGDAGARPLTFRSQWFRTARAAPASSQPYWVSVSSPAAECTRTAAASLCMFVSASDPGALVTIDESGLAFALSYSGNQNASAWRVAPWARLVRVRALEPAGVTLRINVLEPVLKHGRDLLRASRASRAAEVHPLGEGAFWIEGGPPEAGARLEIAGPLAATGRVDLAQVRGSPLTVFDVALAVEEVIEGDVRSRGALLPGATVTLMRLLHPSDRDGDDDDQPMERVGERVTDETGRFRFRGLAREKHELVVSHPRRGRARLVVSAPAIERVTLTPHAVVRGRVMRDGVPAAGATVTVLPSYDAVTSARNPMTLFSESAKTGLDGRFEVLLPDEGRLTLTAVHEGAATRIELGDAGALSPVVDVGDLRISQPLDVTILLDLPASCVLAAAGPIGQPGLLLRLAEPDAAGRWLLRSALEGRWLIEASCDGVDVPLETAVIDISRARREIVRLAVRRHPAP